MHFCEKQNISQCKNKIYKKAQNKPPCHPALPAPHPTSSQSGHWAPGSKNRKMDRGLQDENSYGSDSCLCPLTEVLGSVSTEAAQGQVLVVAKPLRHLWQGRWPAGAA